MAPVLVTLNDPEGHSPVAGLFKCNPSNICAAFYHISTDSVLVWSLTDIWASCFACLSVILWNNIVCECDFAKKTMYRSDFDIVG